MIKLKKIISHLDEQLFNVIRDQLRKNNAENSLFLFQAYRDGKPGSDDDIREKLSLSANSFYVLKSRLYDKVQEHITGETRASQEDAFKQLQQIPDMCLGAPREIAVAFLDKLEKDLLLFDMHNELLQVYSACKKIHLHSGRYFHYSQLYNKHVAFSLSLEKSDEILGHFNRILARYDFSRDPEFVNELQFLRKEIADHYTLNPSRHVELIRNMIDLQLSIFCKPAIGKAYNVEEGLHNSHRLLQELPQFSILRKWQLSLNYLSFEHYRQTGQHASSVIYYDKVNEDLRHLMLHSHICLTPRFLVSKIRFLQELDRMEELATEHPEEFLFDTEDMHALVYIGMYKAMLNYYAGKYKEAISILNELLNVHSFKDYFHANLDVKLTLVFMYMVVDEPDLADNMLKSIYRKIKSDGMEQYGNALDLVKVFGMEINAPGDKKKREKQRDQFMLFKVKNNGEHEILCHLQSELEKRYMHS